MSELSRLLGDVYGSEGAVPSDAPEEREGDHGRRSDGPVELHVDVPAPAGAASDVAESTVGRRSTLPAWADDDVLDQAFEQWVPGPPSEAPAAERSMLSDLASHVAETTDGTSVGASPAGDDADWLFRDAGAVTSEDARASSAHAPVERQRASAPTGAEERRPWRREDDDILPVGRGRGRRR